MIKVKTKVGDVGLYSNEDMFLIRRGGNKPQTTQSYILNNTIGKLSQLDKELEEFVDSHDYGKIAKDGVNLIMYKDYIYNINPEFEELFDWATPKQSFISLIKSQHPEFQEDKEWLVIKLL